MYPEAFKHHQPVEGCVWVASRGQQHNRSEGRWPANLPTSSGASSDSAPGHLVLGQTGSPATGPGLGRGMSYGVRPESRHPESWAG